MYRTDFISIYLLQSSKNKQKNTTVFSIQVNINDVVNEDFFRKGGF